MVTNVDHALGSLSQARRQCQLMLPAGPAHKAITRIDQAVEHLAPGSYFAVEPEDDDAPLWRSWGRLWAVWPFPFTATDLKLSDDQLRLKIAEAVDRGRQDRQALEVVAEMLNGGDVDGARHHLEEVLHA
jgi:hypothetical protein